MVEILQPRLPSGGQASVFNLNSWVVINDPKNRHKGE